MAHHVNDGLYRQQEAINAIYRAETGRRTGHLGYELERTHADGRFEIVGVSREVIEAFPETLSSRSLPGRRSRPLPGRRRRIAEACVHSLIGVYFVTAINKCARSQIVINTQFQSIANSRDYARFAESVRMAVYQTTRHATPAPMSSEPRVCPGLRL